jgi:hypothetical protein
MLLRHRAFALLSLLLPNWAFSTPCSEYMKKAHNYHYGWVYGNAGFSLLVVPAIFTIPNAGWNAKMAKKFQRAHNLLVQSETPKEKLAASADIIVFHKDLVKRPNCAEVSFEELQANLAIMSISGSGICSRPGNYHAYQRLLKWEVMLNTVEKSLPRVRPLVYAKATKVEKPAIATPVRNPLLFPGH